MNQQFKNLKLISWHWPALIILAIIFFLTASSFNFLVQKDDFIKWLSPDEMANYIFAKLYGQEGRLTIFEKYNLLAEDIIKPRSFRSDQGWLKPVSFLGLPLIYGKIAALTNYKILPYLTPLFAALGLIYYYLLVKMIFSRANAWLSVLMLAFFPVYFFYSARSLFHNILFMVLILVGLYYAILMVKVKKQKNLPNQNKEPTKIISLIYAGLAGFLFGLAIMVRASELLWLLPLLIILWLFNFKKISLPQILIFLALVSLAYLPAAYWNQILYGSFWSGGYSEMNQTLASIAQNSGNLILTISSAQFTQISGLLNQLQKKIFYFGWQPLASIKMLYYYFTQMFYWLFWPALAGAILFLLKIKKWKIRHYAYFVGYIVVSLILVFYYGSWGIHDNPNPASFTIGNSYTRYWLPIYLGAIPLASYFIIKLSNLFKTKIFVMAVRFLIIFLLFVLCLKFVLSDPEEGLAISAIKLSASRAQLTEVMNLTPKDSVIITQYHDKLFFPERKVIVGLFDDEKINQIYAKLTRYLPVYYYNFTLPEKDLDYLNQRKLPEFNLQITPVAQITKDFTLYQLKTIE